MPFMAEVPASGDAARSRRSAISGLPVGPKYQVMVGIGPVNERAYSLRSYYGESGLFLVNPNADTSVNVVASQSQLLLRPSISPRTSWAGIWFR